MDKPGAAYDICELARQSVPEFASGDWQLLSCQLVGAEAHGKSAIGRYAVVYRSGEGETHGNLVAKLYRKHPARVRAAYEGIRRLWNAGFKPPAPFRVPRPYGYSIEPAVLFMEDAPGVSWRDLMFRGRDELVFSSQKAADCLVRFQECGLSFNCEQPEVLVSRLRAMSVRLQLAIPDLSPRIRGTATRIEQALPYSWQLKPSHGDFRNAHVLIASGFTTLIDLDGLAMREPALDVGHVIGHIITMSRFETGSYDTGAEAASMFLRRYLSQAEVDLSRIRLHIGRAIFQRAIRIAAKRAPQDEVIRWLDLIDRFLEVDAQMPLLKA